MINLRIKEHPRQPNTGSWKDKVLIPYKNNKGQFVWRTEGDPADMTWPGTRSPKWATDLILFNGVWYWAAEK